MTHKLTWIAALSVTVSAMSGTPSLGHNTPDSLATKCQAAKAKAAAKHSLCQLLKISKALKFAASSHTLYIPPDLSDCDEKFNTKCVAIESLYLSDCPTVSDCPALQDTTDQCSDSVYDKLPADGERFVDNGDLTVTDRKTGLMWEKKTALNYLNTFSWSTNGFDPDGGIFGYLQTFNDCSSPDGQAVMGGFAGYCDWRLPTVSELQSILDVNVLGCSDAGPCTEPLCAACIDPMLGPTAIASYWSSSTGPSVFPWGKTQWKVSFYNGSTHEGLWTTPAMVRAVRKAD